MRRKTCLTAVTNLSPNPGCWRSYHFAAAANSDLALRRKMTGRFTCAALLGSRPTLRPKLRHHWDALRNRLFARPEGGSFRRRPVSGFHRFPDRANSEALEPDGTGRRAAILERQ